MLEERGAEAIPCPMIAIRDAPDAEPVAAWLRWFVKGTCDDLVLMTGEGLRRLLSLARRIDLEPAFLDALRMTRKITRGPKPSEPACEERQPQCCRPVKHHDGGQHKQRACHFPQRLPALVYFSVASMALWMWLLHPSPSFLAIICCASPNSLVAVAFASPSPMA